MPDGRESGLTVVTVLYRSAGMLSETLPTWVRGAGGLPVRFVFVDNWPEDGCAKVIAGLLPADRYRYLPDGANPGFAAGCNRAVAAAATTHVLLLNPDVWLLADSLPRIWAAIEQAPRSPIAIGLNMHGGHYTGIDVHPVALFIDRPSGVRRGPLGPSGGAAVFPAAVFDELGGFHAPLFAWGEDADLAFRLYATGLHTRALDLGLPHKGGHSVDGDAELLGFRAYLLARNRILVAARCFSWPLALLAIPFLAVAHLALALRRARQGLLRPFLRGVGRGLLGAVPARRRWTGARFGIASIVSYLRRAG
jgi:GT2 family glycosyltransferase